MNRKNFGQLIEVLRHETAYLRPNNKSFTQKEMAENLGITLRHYGRLERGEVVNIEGELLTKLADAFSLTSRERHEFFYAAGGVSQFAFKQSQDELENLMNKLTRIVKESIFPVFVSDVLGNILLGAKGAMPIVGFDKDEFLELKYPNVLWAPMQIDLSHAFVQEELIRVMIANLRLIRGTSLRYRALHVSKTLFADLEKYPQFKAAWQWVSSDSGMDFEESRVFKQNHPTFDMELAYFSLGSKVVTSWGELFVTTFTPYDEKTFFKFKELKTEYGDEIVQTNARWPYPPKIG